MGMKEQQRSVYKTALNGRPVDMHKLRMQNEMAVAVGNVKVNARGDELGPNGQIIRRREEVLRASSVSVPDQQSTRNSQPVQQESKSTEVTAKSSKKTSTDTDTEGSSDGN
jgi:hypothetical protein